MNSLGISSASKRRDKLFIIAEILQIARDGTLKTQVMYKANLSFTQLNDYLDFMLKIGFLEKEIVRDKDIYKATDKGMDFLQRYNEIAELLKADEDCQCKNNVKIPPQRLLKRS